MIELVQRLLSLEWRRHGATVHEAKVDGSSVWYADFAPHPERRGRVSLAPGRRWDSPLQAPGAPPPLVLLHGLGASAVSFHPVIPRLRLGFRVIVPDLPGFGLSRPPRGRDFLPFRELCDVAEAFVDEVAPAGAFLAGNSMGGWIATRIAARRPDLARGIGLLNPGGPALNAEDWIDFVRLLRDEDSRAVSQLVSRLFHRPPRGMSLLAREFRRIMRAPSVLELVSALEPDDFLCADEVAGVRCPAVVIWGEDERIIPEGCRCFYLENLPRVRHVSVPDCGHCPQIEAPRRTAQALLELRCLETPGAVDDREELSWGRGEADAATAPA